MSGFSASKSSMIWASATSRGAVPDGFRNVHMRTVCCARAAVPRQRSPNAMSAANLNLRFFINYLLMAPHISVRTECGVTHGSWLLPEIRLHVSGFPPFYEHRFFLQVADGVN